ncbi:hypothetical protein MBANPS3_008134 [Mucor bainieri]
MAKPDSDTTSNSKKKSDDNQESDITNNSESDLDDNIFLVETIVAHVHDDQHGQIMYEIKWKGYPSRCDNTYEPERNLGGCRDLLMEYKSKAGLLKRRAESSSSSPSASSASKTKKKKKPKRRESFEPTADRAASSTSRKAPTPDIFSSDDDDDEPLANKISKGKEKATENKQTKDKGQEKGKSKEAPQQQSSSTSKYKIPKYSALQPQQSSPNEQQHGQASNPSSSTSPSTKSNIPQTPPSLFIHKDHTPSSSSSSALANFKRSTALKSTHQFELQKFISGFNGGILQKNIPAAPKSHRVHFAPMPVLDARSSSSNTTPAASPITQTAIRTNPRMPGLALQRQPPPPVQPQSQHPPSVQPQSQHPQVPQRPPPQLPPHQPFHQQLAPTIPTIPTKRPTRPDPRLTAANERKKLKLSNNEACKMELMLKKGNDQVCSVTLSGAADKVPQWDRIKHLLQLQNPEGNEVTINSFLPLRRFSDYLPADKPMSFMSVIPTDQFIQSGKLRNFMSVNEITGIASHPDMPTEALFIMAAKDVSKISSLATDTGLENPRTDQLFAIFVDNLPPRPQLKPYDVNYQDESEQLFSWRQMCLYLKFPEELQQLWRTTNFLVYGHSESSIMLSKACSALPTRKDNQPLLPQNIMMFDRFNNELQYKSLLKHKREPVTQIWEFGVPNFYYGDIKPACEVFPQHSGGFITTDTANIINNPHIIEGIFSQIRKFNDLPVAFGEWKFVLPYGVLLTFKQMLYDGENSVAVQEALIYLTIALSNGDVEIIRTWPEEKQEPNSIVFMKHVLREYYKTRQYFVYVDDIGAVDARSKETHVSIDFVTTESIYRTFA